MKNLIKQTVYLPVRVGDERTPEFYRDRLFLLKGNVRDVGEYFGDSVFYSQVETKTTENVTHWLKPQEAFVFTPEQLNEYTANVIKQALETASEKAQTIFFKDECLLTGQEFETRIIDKKSIANTFEETFKLFQV